MPVNFKNIKTTRGRTYEEDAIPSLGVYKDKLLGFIPNNYYVPNMMHPIAKKNRNYFMASLLPHGRFPEEHWANYLGSKAVGENSTQYAMVNLSNELSLPPKGFLRDYQQYLSNTYKPLSFFFK